MKRIPFKQVDVFTAVPFKGNPVAVVLDAGNLSQRQMQQIANWTNLSETTFVLPPTHLDADYQVRIFTPNAELPFAGHPTIGTAHALIEAGMIRVSGEGELVQQCAAGLIRLTVTKDEESRCWIEFELPSPTLLPLNITENEELEKALGARLLKDRSSPMLVDIGVKWVVAAAPNADSVLSMRPDFERVRAQSIRLGCAGVTVYGRCTSDKQTAIEVRSFAPAHGVNEDPVCGSGTGSVGVFIRNSGQGKILGNQFLVSQGSVVGRSGILSLKLSDESIKVGGMAVTCIDGDLSV
ncbi:MAG: PhzF family phenazine biosynthesis protein [Acidiferrobacteraceae bacterium]